MAKKTRRGQKQCPKCNAWVKGTRTKSCPKCNHPFFGKVREVRVPHAVAAVVAEKPAKAPDTVTIEQVKAVSLTVKAIGGFARLNDLLGLVRDIGGVRRFKELLDALSAAEAGTTAV